jgi:hypothetical protein
VEEQYGCTPSVFGTQCVRWPRSQAVLLFIRGSRLGIAFCIFLWNSGVVVPNRVSGVSRRVGGFQVRRPWRRKNREVKHPGRMLRSISIKISVVSDVATFLVQPCDLHAWTAHVRNQKVVKRVAMTCGVCASCCTSRRCGVRWRWRMLQHTTLHATPLPWRNYERPRTFRRGGGFSWRQQNCCPFTSPERWPSSLDLSRVQCTCNVTLRRVHETILAMVKQ